MTQFNIIEVKDGKWNLVIYTNSQLVEALTFYDFHSAVNALRLAHGKF